MMAIEYFSQENLVLSFNSFSFFSFHLDVVYTFSFFISDFHIAMCLVFLLICAISANNLFSLLSWKLCLLAVSERLTCPESLLRLPHLRGKNIMELWVILIFFFILWWLPLRRCEVSWSCFTATSPSVWPPTCCHLGGVLIHLNSKLFLGVLPLFVKRKRLRCFYSIKYQNHRTLLCGLEDPRSDSSAIAVIRSLCNFVYVMN